MLVFRLFEFIYKKIKLMTKVLVTGGNSRFATKLKETKSRYNFIYTNKKQFNILNFS